MATTFLVDSLGATARLQVQLAFGADLAAASGTWTWTDVTGDVRNLAQIAMTHGAGDEASTSQPATCRFTLDNRAGAYSLGVQSSNYPNVRANTPVRVRVDPSGSGTTYSTLFQGNVTGFTPQWDSTGADASVAVDGAGILRRLAQGPGQVTSPLRRAVLADTSTVIGYWPCEEPGNVDQLASGLPDGQPMVVSGYPNFGSSTVFACSAPLPTLNGGDYLGFLPRYTATGAIQVRFLLDIPAGGATALSVPLRLNTGGSACRWDVQYNTGGDIRIRATDALDATLLDSGLVGMALDGRRGQFGLQLTQSGSDIEWAIYYLEIGAEVGTGFSGTVLGQTIDVAHSVHINLGQGNNDGVTIGHVLVQDTLTSEADNIVALNAHDGESPADRLTRLAAENGLALTQTGDSGSTLGAQDADMMGPQRVGTLVDLLRECETAERGSLYDGTGDGLAYATRRGRLNADAAFTVAHTQLVMPFAPIHDDQRTRNLFTVTRKDAGQAVVEDVSGPLGSAAIGTYSEALTVNTALARAAEQYAGWLVHQGTTPGYRYPTLTIDLGRNPELATAWLACRIGSRIDVTGIDTARTQHPTGTLSFILEGYSQIIDQHQWVVTLNLSPFEPWRIIRVAEDTGATSEYTCRLESDGSTLAAGAAAGATSLSVATPSGPLWTTTADDLPLDVEISGRQITVTAISGATSPQTFTVSAIPAALTLGASVTPWRAPVLSL